MKNFFAIVVSVGLIAVMFIILRYGVDWETPRVSNSVSVSTADAGLLSKDCSYPWGLVRAGRCIDRELGVVCYTINDGISCFKIEGVKE